MLPNIVLIGFMGSGKSSVGRRIAALTGHRFLDTDELVMARTGKSIVQTFSDEGEAHFRDLESAELRALESARDVVLATGGGIILRPENHFALRRIGPVAWLDADPDLLFERVSRNRKRPLLHTENPRETFDALLAGRRETYEAAADFRVDSTALSHDEAALAVLEEVERRVSGRD